MSIPNSGSDLPECLRALLHSRGGQDVERAVRELIEERESALFVRLGQLARDLHESVKSVCIALDADGSAPLGVLEARQSLDQALDLSERAAHQSLDVGDRLLQHVDALAARVRAGGDANPMVSEVLAFTDVCHAEVRALREAQGLQDLTGQRMKQVAAFLGRVEESVLALVQLAGSLGVAPASAPSASKVKVTTQEQVDDLLAQFGF